MRIAQEAQQASWGLPEALWQRMKPLITPKKGITGHRAPSTSDASPRGSSTSSFATPRTLLQVMWVRMVLERADGFDGL
jgi:hypothetical protein